MPKCSVGDREVQARVATSGLCFYRPSMVGRLLFIASNRPYNWVSFLHAILCYHKSMDSVTFSIDSGVMSVQKYINSMRRRWNSTAIKRMRERLKPGPFSSSSGLGTRLFSPLIKTHLAAELVAARESSGSQIMLGCLDQRLPVYTVTTVHSHLAIALDKRCAADSPLHATPAVFAATLLYGVLWYSMVL